MIPGASFLFFFFQEANSRLSTSHYQCIRNKDVRFTVQSFTKLYIICEPLLQMVNLRRALLLRTALVEVVLVDLDLLGVPGLAAVGGRETIRGGASQAEGVAESRVGLVEVNGDVLPAWRITSSASNSYRHLKARGFGWEKLTVALKGSAVVAVALVSRVEDLELHAGACKI